MKLSELNPAGRKTLMLYGQSGSGKTCFATSFPGPVLVFDFDGKISSAASFHKGTPQLTEIEYESLAGASFSKFWKRFLELRKLAENPAAFPYKTIVLDSVTTFSVALMQEVIKQNPGTKRMKVNETIVACLPDYQIAISHFKDIVTGMLSWPCNVIATAHIQTSKDETTGEITREPLVYGKDLPAWLPMVFEEVYRCYAEKKDGKPAHFAQTRADTKYVARTQIRSIPDPFILTQEEFKKYV